MTETNETNKFEFGFEIGCFFFTPKKNKVKQSILVDSINKFLNNQTNISQLKITPLLNEEDWEEEYYTDEIHENNDPELDGYIPLGDINIEFRLFLPEKNQRDISPHFWSADTV